MNIKRILIFAFFQLFIFCVAGQSNITLNNNAAYKFYMLEEYNSALQLAESKITEFPKDPTYQYVAGISLFKLNGEIDKAIKYLEFSSNDTSIPVDVFYHLGILYRKNYNFQKSIEALSRYKELSTVNQRQKSNIDKEIATSKNGKTFVAYISDVPVISNDEIESNDFFLYYSVLSKNRKLAYAPENLLAYGDKENNHKPIICMPESPAEGTKVVFSSYGNKPKGDKNIYYIEYKNDGTWSKPKILSPIINSSEDEDYPFLSDDGLTLYFSSKGLFSLGGYDIFVSHFNKEYNSWSEPESLDFPINSPFDDILFICNNNNTTANFSSNRETKQDKLNLYTVKVIKSPIQRPPVDHDEILKMSKLQTTTENSIPNIQIEDKIDFSSVSTKEIGEDKFEDLYNEKLSTALRYQMKADSLRRIVDVKRMSLSKLIDNTKKENLKFEIELLESDIYSIQNMADKAYQEVRITEEKQFKEERTYNKSTETVRYIPQCFINQIKSDKSIEDLELKYRMGTSALENVMNGDLSFYSLNELSKSISNLAVSIQKLKESDNISINEEDIQNCSRQILTGQGIINNSGKENKYTKQEAENLLRGIRLKFEGLNILEKKICNDVENIISIKGIEITDKIIDSIKDSVIKSSETPIKKAINDQIVINIKIDKEPEFEILDSIYYNENNPIPENLEIPDGVIYMVQLGVYSKPLKYSAFNGMRPITCEILDNKKYKYYAGKFTLSKTAFDNLKTIKSKGYKQAFIVPFYNGTKTTLNRAKLLESDSAIPEKNSGSPSYKVQVYISDIPLPIEKYEEIKKIIENKTLFKYKNPKGLYIYNVGDFKNKESTQKYLNLFLKMGYTNARIVE